MELGQDCKNPLHREVNVNNKNIVAAPAAPYTPNKNATIIFSVGPNCPVRCEGCYNHFGNTAKHGGLISAHEILEFAEAAAENGLIQSTVAGGDPLFHPEIVAILKGFKSMKLRVKLDTVGTSLLGDARIVFKGKGMSSAVAVETVTPHVDFVNIPLDGASQKTMEAFRKGRAHLFDETRRIGSILRAHDVRFGYNTVVNTANIKEIEAIRVIAEEDGASEWQLFEYDPKGPNPTLHRDHLSLTHGQFDNAVSKMLPSRGTMKIDYKSLKDRTGAYFLIDDSGLAWKPSGAGERFIIGHVTRNRERVLDAWKRHVTEMRLAPRP